MTALITPSIASILFSACDACMCCCATCQFILQCIAKVSYCASDEFCHLCWPLIKLIHVIALCCFFFFFTLQALKHYEPYQPNRQMLQCDLRIAACVKVWCVALSPEYPIVYWREGLSVSYQFVNPSVLASWVMHFAVSCFQFIFGHHNAKSKKKILFRIYQKGYSKDVVMYGTGTVTNAKKCFA